MFRKRFCVVTPLACAMALAVPAVAQAAPFVHGTMYDDSGQPLKSTVVTIYLDQLPDGSQTAGVQLDKIATTTTDANGGFTVDVATPDAATKAQMAEHGGWANYDVFANGPDQQVTTGFSRTFDSATGVWDGEDGNPVTATNDAVDGHATAQPPSNLQPAGGATGCMINPVGDYWTTWNPIVRLHMGEHMTGFVAFQNDQNSSMQSELSASQVSWGSSTFVHLDSSSLDHSTPLSGAVSNTIRANINNHRYQYLYCGNYLQTKALPKIWRAA